MTLGTSLDVLRGAIRAAAVSPQTAAPHPKKPVKPVVTISRQAGIETSGLVQQLLDDLTARDSGDQDWAPYDRELVERVAEDHNLAADLVASLDEHDKSWFEHFTEGLRGEATGSDIAIKTARSIRGLARLGRAVIVGRGGQCILAGFEHALHVRLVAPAAWRADRYQETAGVDAAEAEKAIREIDRERRQFIKNHFGHDVDDASLYHLIINVKRIPPQRAGSLIAHVIDLAD